VKVARGVVAALTIVVACITNVRPAVAQAWAPRAGEGDVTFVTQMIDHIGRINGDTRVDCCGTTNVAVAVDVDYGLSSRLSVSGSLPYVFAKYRGGPPDPNGPVSFLPYPEVDSCHCVHSGFQDLALGMHYNLLKSRRDFSLMTSMTVGEPTHNYEYAGEAVIGFGLTELGINADAGGRLHSGAPGLALDGHYGYTIVERALDISHNRSNARLHAGYDLPGRIGAHMILSWQHTYGGLRMPDDVEPYPERYTEFHRLLKDNYFQAGAGASYTWGHWDMSLSLTKTISGTDTHAVHVYTVTAGRSFRLSH
jgi:hypothetical protein